MHLSDWIYQDVREQVQNLAQGVTQKLFGCFPHTAPVNKQGLKALRLLAQHRFLAAYARHALVGFPAESTLAKLHVKIGDGSTHVYI